MTTEVDKVALTIFAAFFLLVTMMGFIAARWRRPKTLAHLEEWGLGGRQFGTWITWFLVGGDFYTAYTVIAVPALVYAVGAYGFFALPYTIIVYPFVFVVMPVLWRVAKTNGYVTAADVVHGRYGSRALELAVAVTGVIATMPYIALQLVGMAAVFKALGLAGELPLVTAFVVLAVYTYSSGLRAPALIAFVKDTMIYIAVFAAVAVIPSRFGGYAAVFEAADAAFLAKGSGGILLAPDQYLPYATLALGSALAAFMYPHTLTGVFASASANTIRKNAILLPRVYAAAGSLGASRLYGPRGRLDAFQQQRCRPGPLQGDVPGLVCRLCLCRHRNRGLGPGGSHEHRRGQPVHPQFLEGLCQSRSQCGGRGAGR
jgi:solute:Na+ symporter, SSS family